MTALPLVVPDATAQSQQAAAPRVSLLSPDIQIDNTVTFRLKAPQATAVLLKGDWGAETPFTGDSNGMWTATVGPLSPGIYAYSFSVNGVLMPDPANSRLKPSRSPVTSFFEIVGKSPDIYDERPGVSRGTVHLLDYDSQSLGLSRRLRVYTPAEYQLNPRRRFPILYLLHGAGDNEAVWTEFGRANVILDNLIAAKQAVPMLVVMPDGHATSGYSPEDRAANAAQFERDFLLDVMPLVEKNYRVRSGRENRAIVGLSMGGNQALLIGLNHRELFASVGGMSSAIREPVKPLAGFWKQPKDQRNEFRLLWLRIGREDFLIKENRAFEAMLTAAKVPHDYTETEGGHTWPNWRRYLIDLLPRLFETDTRKARPPA